MNFDIIIIGGGIAGIISALGLVKKGLKVALLELKPLDTLLSLQKDGKAFAISQGSWLVLQKYGLSQVLAAEAGIISHIRVCDDDSFLKLDFPNNLVDDAPLGYMIEHNLMLKEFYHLAIKEPNLTIYAAQTYKNITFNHDHVAVELSNKTITASLLIGSDGKHSKIRQLTNIETKSWHYDQVAIVCKVSHELHHQNIAIERFFPAGPFAILPLADGYSSSVVWVEKKELAELYLNMPPEELLHYLTERFSDYLGNLKIVGEIFHYKLSCSYAKKFYCPRMALIADAAHAIHPIAGQGLNLGIADIDCLIDNISAYAGVGLDVGSSILLKKYHQQRFAPVMAMLIMTDGLNRLFSNNNRFLSVARRIGMAGVDKISILKKKIMQHAMQIN